MKPDEVYVFETEDRVTVKKTTGMMSTIGAMLETILGIALRDIAADETIKIIIDSDAVDFGIRNSRLMAKNGGKKHERMDKHNDDGRCRKGVEVELDAQSPSGALRHRMVRGGKQTEWIRGDIPSRTKPSSGIAESAEND